MALLWLDVVLTIYLFQIATILIVEFRHPAKTIAWLLILFIVPIIGFIVYYFVAKEYTQRKRVSRKGRSIMEDRLFDMMERAGMERSVHAKESELDKRLLAFLQKVPYAPLSKNNTIQILRNGMETYDAIMKAIQQAKHHIHLEYYIVRQDRTGIDLQQLLIKKAKEGMQVRLIFDGVGSHVLSTKYIRRLRNAGVEVHSFLPPFIAFIEKRMNYRNHRKIVVVDGTVGFLGGINIGDEYLGKNKRLGFWRDTHVRIEGESVSFLQSTFMTDWVFVSGQKEIDVFPFFPKQEFKGTEEVQIIASGPDAKDDAIFGVYFSAISTAKQRIYITTPYFIPDESIYIALKTAAISGVDVRVIIPGVSDSKIVKNATLSYVEELMIAGVKFYEYQKGFMHAKIFLVDDSLGSVGTANMDMRSFFNNFEINAFFFNQKTLRQLEKDFLLDLEDSKQMILNEFARRPRWQKFSEILCHLLSPLL